MPLVQVSLFHSEDPDQHYRLGQAVASLRDENIVIIGAGMSVHNLRDMFASRGSPTPMPYTVSFDEALKDATESSPAERQARMAEAAKRPDARQAHPVRNSSSATINSEANILARSGWITSCRYMLRQAQQARSRERGPGRCMKVAWAGVNTDLERCLQNCELVDC